jgi:hypothetical protein
MYTQSLYFLIFDLQNEMGRTLTNRLEVVNKDDIFAMTFIMKLPKVILASNNFRNDHGCTKPQQTRFVRMT